MKNAIVTGGTKGIGRGVTEMLLKKGYKVISTYAHDKDSAIAFEKEMKQCKFDLQVTQVDQSVRAQTYTFIESIKKDYSHIDCIVCNAGITIRKKFQDSKDSDWDAMMEVAVNSHYILLRELYDIIPHGSRIIFTGSEMALHPHGTVLAYTKSAVHALAMNLVKEFAGTDIIPHGSRIIFTGSEMALHPHGTVLAYGVTKSAVHALAMNLVKEFAGTDTTVNVVAPGFVDTEWQKKKPHEIRNNICDKTAIHRFAKVSEIAKAYEFIIDNPFVNGTILNVDGGYCYK
jgi:3-oxoacyl-[acyl-carrier protein] reductase